MNVRHRMIWKAYVMLPMKYRYNHVKFLMYEVMLKDL